MIYHFKPLLLKRGQVVNATVIDYICKMYVPFSIVKSDMGSRFSSLMKWEEQPVNLYTHNYII